MQTTIFFRFPINNTQIYNKWIDFVRKNSSKVKSDKIFSRHSSICSQHFLETDFTRIGGQSKKFLKKTAIPSIINQGEMKIQPVEIEVIEDVNPSILFECCALCRTQSANYHLNLFDEYSYSLIRKCIPFVNFNLSFMQKICVDCLAILNTFSSFIDKIIIAQNIFNQEMVQQQQNEIINVNMRPLDIQSSTAIPRIKIEPQNHDDEPKIPFLKPINFSTATTSSQSLKTSQKKLEILEIVDIKPLNFLPMATNALNCEESSYEEDECQILSPPQLKVEIAEDGDGTELELIKNDVHLSTISLHDHNYVNHGENINVKNVKKETDHDIHEIFDYSQIPVELHVEVNDLKICCNKSFNSIRKFLLHKMKRHQKLHYCSKCQKLFKNFISLKHHKVKCFKLNDMKRNNLYKKVICKLKNKRILMTKKKKEGSKVYACPICNKSFKGPKNVYQHKLSHLEAINRCYICNKVFKRKHGLKQHIKVQHENEKKYLCSICNHSYGLKGDVKKCKHRDLKQKTILNFPPSPGDTLVKSYVMSSRLTRHKNTETLEQEDHSTINKLE